MSLSASIALSSATCKSEQKVTATVTITNTGAGAVNVTSAVGTAVPHSATNGSVPVAIGTMPVGGAFPVSVPGSSGTLAISFDVVPHAPVTSYPTGIAEGEGSYVYDIGANITTSDGSAFSPSTTTLTVSTPSS